MTLSNLGRECSPHTPGTLLVRENLGATTGGTLGIYQLKARTLQPVNPTSIYIPKRLTCNRGHTTGDAAQERAQQDTLGAQWLESSCSAGDMSSNLVQERSHVLQSN